MHVSKKITLATAAGGWTAPVCKPFVAACRPAQVRYTASSWRPNSLTSFLQTSTALSGGGSCLPLQVTCHCLQTQSGAGGSASSCSGSNSVWRASSCQLDFDGQYTHPCLQTYTSQVESPLLLKRELNVTPQAATEDEGFSLKANALTREVTATMRVEDGAALEMVIKLPLSWPLKTADVECRRTVRQQLCRAPAYNPLWKACGLQQSYWCTVRQQPCCACLWTQRGPLSNVWPSPGL